MSNRAESGRFIGAIKSAESAFWREFTSHYPEIKTGDLSPLTAFRLQQQMEVAATEWLEVNQPKIEGESNE